MVSGTKPTGTEGAAGIGMIDSGEGTLSGTSPRAELSGRTPVFGIMPIGGASTRPSYYP